MAIHTAAIHNGELEASLEWHPDSSVLAALDHGIPLDFIVTVTAQAAPVLGWHRSLSILERHLQLRYYPLSRQYQWLDAESGQTRNYAARALLIAALEDLRLPTAGLRLDSARRFVLEVRLDRDALPGALRVPALLRPAWRQTHGEFAWPAPAG